MSGPIEMPRATAAVVIIALATEPDNLGRNCYYELILHAWLIQISISVPLCPGL